jgi:endonuclease G
MKKFFFLLMAVSSVHAQDTVRVKHDNYTSVYSKSKHYPLMVEWWDTKDKVACKNQLARIDKFAPDPLVLKDSDLGKDYVGSGLDRGHMSPAADNECSGKKVLEEAFYFTNMVPQYHSLNAGDWKSVETFCRQLATQYDSVHVWAGAVGDATHIKGLVIPTKNWKVMYVPKTKTWYAYIFKDTKEKPVGILHHVVTVDAVTKLTNFKFK